MGWVKNGSVAGAVDWFGPSPIIYAQLALAVVFSIVGRIETAAARVYYHARVIVEPNAFSSTPFAHILFLRRA